MGFWLFRDLPRSHWSRRRFFKFGVPFILTIIGGSFWLKDFMQLRYTFRKQHHMSKTEMENFLGVPMKKGKLDPEDELLEMQKEVETDYKMIRGPRPYEDGADNFAILDAIKARRQEEKARKKALESKSAS